MQRRVRAHERVAAAPVELPLHRVALRGQRPVAEHVPDQLAVAGDADRRAEVDNSLFRVGGVKNKKKDYCERETRTTSLSSVSKNGSGAKPNTRATMMSGKLSSCVWYCFTAPL